jgi:hypothetical protein
VQAILVVVVFCYWFNHLVGDPISKHVRRHVKPRVNLIKEWFQHLKSKINWTIKAITQHTHTHCFEEAFVQLVWKPMAMTSCRVRGRLMAWLKPELSKEKKEERQRQEQVRIATEQLHQEHLRRAGNSWRNYSTKWQGLRYSIVLNLLFWLPGVNGQFHPIMSTILELNPQFEWSRETLVACASEVYDLPKPATSNNSATPGHLCTFARHETFSEMVPAVFGLKWFMLHGAFHKGLRAQFTLPFQQSCQVLQWWTHSQPSRRNFRLDCCDR